MRVQLDELTAELAEVQLGLWVSNPDALNAEIIADTRPTLWP